jgi:hypothetical protein
MALFDAARVWLAFDASGVCAARVQPRLRGFELCGWAHAPLPEGALVPSAVEPNLRDPEALQRALRHVAAALDLPAGSRVRVALPDGLTRLVLLDEPQGVSAADFALFRLGPGLPYAPDEAIVGTLDLGHGRAVATALRRTLAAEYENALRAIELVPDGVFLAPLLALSELLRRPAARDEVALVLGDAALLLAAFRDGRLRLVRSRRRDPGRDEAERLGDEVWRTAQAADLRDAPRLSVRGAQSAALAAALGLQGHLAQAVRSANPELPTEVADWAWLGGAAV